MFIKKDFWIILRLNNKNCYINFFRFIRLLISIHSFKSSWYVWNILCKLCEQILCNSQHTVFCSFFHYYLFKLVVYTLVSDVQWVILKQKIKTTSSDFFLNLCVVCNCGKCHVINNTNISPVGVFLHGWFDTTDCLLGQFSIPQINLTFNLMYVYLL